MYIQILVELEFFYAFCYKLEVFELVCNTYTDEMMNESMVCTCTEPYLSDKSNYEWNKSARFGAKTSLFPTEIIF